MTRLFHSKLFRVIPVFILSGAEFLTLGVGRAADDKDFTDKLEPVISKYCYDCHGDGSDKGDFVMDDYDTLDEHLGNMGMWYDVWKNLRSNLMPPADKKQPSDEDRAKMLAFIERAVFKIDPNNPDPGLVTIRRLNREEYRHTIKDLLGINFDVDDAFPVDDTGYGFDTIGAVLSISPLLMEKYVEAATDIVAKAVPLNGPQIPTHWFDAKSFRGKDKPNHKLDWIPLESNRKIYGKRWVNYDGEYLVRVDFKISGSAAATNQSGTLKFGVDGKDLISRKVGWDNTKSLSFQTKVKLKKGNGHDFYISMEAGDPPNKGENKIAVQIRSIRMTGPLDGSVKTYPHEFRYVFPDKSPPQKAQEKDVYREKVLRRFASKAFRRPVDQATLDRLVKLSRAVESQPGMRLEHGIAQALTAILASPRFLMRAEIQPEPNDSGKIVSLDEYALASRLSYFLWSSCPDDELLRLAGEGKLRKNIRKQVDRMLKDAKSERFVKNFVGQWLQARDVPTIHIDVRRVLKKKDLAEALRTFSVPLRKSMQQETEKFFAHVLKKNRPATELLTANYTFLDERLAKWYGVDGVKGGHMRKVDLPASAGRGGLLRQGTFLVVTSNPTRTSPVKRGLFVLENLLATPAPPAVPDVPPLEDSQKGKNKNLPLKEILRLHSLDPLCASCHAKMDPIGLALENYNPVGLWREKYRGQAIETEGQLITGEKFKNAAELSQVLAKSRYRDFHRALTEKLMTYALGRGMEYYDAPSIDKIIKNMESRGAKLKEILYGIVESAPFQKRRGDGDLFDDK
ncbi:MAG: DUF1592 domain-containing protein [Verrucomicrobiales bacterium]|nr:DUF1592 domain-containing protein [Verrucomicrobiales bacterium]